MMFYHPLFRDWLIRRKDNESTKFMVDPRNGHLAMALTSSRNNPKDLTSDKILDLCHHMLKAHVFRNHQTFSKDLQSVWLTQTTNVDLLSQALGSTRNIYSPNVNVSRYGKKFSNTKQESCSLFEICNILQIQLDSIQKKSIKRTINLGRNKITSF